MYSLVIVPLTLKYIDFLNLYYCKRIYNRTISNFFFCLFPNTLTVLHVWFQKYLRILRTCSKGLKEATQ